MQKYKSNLTTVSGAAVRGASITVLDESGANASIFLDRAGTLPAGNPLKTAQDGTFEFYAANGRYSLRTDSSGLNVLEEDVILTFDPDDGAVSGPIADAIQDSKDAAAQAQDSANEAKEAADQAKESATQAQESTDQLRSDLESDPGAGLVGLDYSQQYPSPTVGTALATLANTPDWYSRRVMDPIFTDDAGGNEIFPGAGRAVQGLVILDTPSGTKMYMISRPTGTTNAADERCRIVEFNYQVSTGQASHVQFTPELAVGHGEALGGYVDGMGQVWLYTTQSNLDGIAVGTNARKGFSRIRYMGSATTQSDVTSYQLFGLGGSTHELAEYNNGSVGLSQDGSKVLILADSTKELAGPTLFIYDRAAVEVAADPLAVRPLRRFRLHPGTSEGYGRVGVAADAQGIYVVFGTAPFSDHGVVVYDWSGRFIRDVNMDDARGEYTFDQLMGSGATIPNVFELEGAALYKNKLHFVCLEAWRTVGDVVSFAYNDLSQNFASIAAGSVGVFPYDRTNWVPTNRPAGGAYDPLVTYNRGATLTTYRKRVYAIAPYQDTGYVPISGRFLQRSSAMLNTGRNNFNAITYNYPGILRFLGWNENTKAIKRTMEYNDGSLRLWDNTELGEFGMYGSVRAKFQGTARFVSIQGFGGTETTGARSVWFGGTDPELPGGIKDLTSTNSSIAIRESTANGQTTFRNTVAGTVPLIVNHAGGSNEILKLQTSGTTRGSVFSSTSNLQFAAKNGTDLCLSNAPDDGTTISIRWRVSASDNSFRPGADGTQNLANPAARINNSYFAVAPTVGSDARLKQQPRKATAAEKAAAAEIRELPCAYKLNQAVDEKGDDQARWHWGLYAQDVVEALVRNGVDWRQQGFIGHDVWDDEYEEFEAVTELSQILGPDGKPFEVEVTPARRVLVREAGDRYSIRYQELEWFLKAAGL